MWNFSAAGARWPLCAAALAALAGCGSPLPGTPSAPEPSRGAEHTHPAASVGSITPDDWRHDTASSVEELIAGRVAGVRVTRLANGGFSMRVRGTGSVYGSSEPLVVIDGVPVYARAAGSAMAGLNPRDVARIEVLRDAASAALYGMQAANGVIVITTRRTP